MRNLIQGILFALCIFSIQQKSFAQEATHQKPDLYTASFYADRYQGRPTSTGDKFDQNEFTCASNHYKLGTYLKVVNLANGKIVYVKVNDKMANFKNPRVDLSKKAFSKISHLDKGLTKVKVYVVDSEIAKDKILAQKGGTFEEVQRENEL